MSIVSKQITSLSAHGNSFRARFEFIFDDARAINIGPISVASQAEADAKLISLEPSALEQMQSRDMDDAVNNDSDIAQNREASPAQIARHYFKSAMASTDIVEAYRWLKKVQNYITSNGWTAAQVKAQLNLTDNQWSAIQARYSYFEANKTIIQAYRDLTDPRGDF